MRAEVLPLLLVMFATSDVALSEEQYFRDLYPNTWVATVPPTDDSTTAVYGESSHSELCCPRRR